MKILLLIIFSLGLLATSVEWLDPMTHDFGDVVRNESVTTTFEFRNTGSEPLLIDNVRTSCGCTVPDWDKAVVPPNATGRISVEYDARDPGYFRKYIKVYFRGRRRAEKLFIEGYVE